MDLFADNPSDVPVEETDWLEGLDFAEEAGISTDEYVTLQWSGGRKYLHSDGQKSISQLMLEGQITTNGAIDYYVDGGSVNSDYVPGIGATVSVVGNVKAG